MNPTFPGRRVLAELVAWEPASPSLLRVARGREAQLRHLAVFVVVELLVRRDVLRLFLQAPARDTGSETALRGSAATCAVSTVANRQQMAQGVSVGENPGAP